MRYRERGRGWQTCKCKKEISSSSGGVSSSSGGVSSSSGGVSSSSGGVRLPGGMKGQRQRQSKAIWSPLRG